MSSPRRKFDKEYKEMVVNLCQAGKEPKVVANEMGLDSSMVHRWLREHTKYGANSFKGNGNTVMTEAEAEIARLKKELKDVQLERDILKKAVGIFSKSDSRSTGS